MGRKYPKINAGQWVSPVWRGYRTSDMERFEMEEEMGEIVIAPMVNARPPKTLREAHAAGVLAGLKEAAEMLEAWAVEWGTVGDGYVDILAENFGKAIRVRITALEGNS